VTFRESGGIESNNSLASTTVAPDGYKTVEIEAHSARSAVEELDIPPPDTMKVDVEGAEYRVLQGCDDDIFNRLELLLVELHHIYTEDNNTIPYLKRKGFDTTLLLKRNLNNEYQTEHYKANSV